MLVFWLFDSTQFGLAMAKTNFEADALFDAR